VFCRRGCWEWRVFTVFWWKCGWVRPVYPSWTYSHSSC